MTAAAKYLTELFEMINPIIYLYTRSWYPALPRGNTEMLDLDFEETNENTLIFPGFYYQAFFIVALRSSISRYCSSFVFYLNNEST